jgi:hypothetical protein
MKRVVVPVENEIICSVLFLEFAHTWASERPSIVKFQKTIQIHETGSIADDLKCVTDGLWFRQSETVKYTLPI